MKIFLDDERPTPEGWYRVYNIHQLIHLFLSHAHSVEEISLDNDLGVGYEEGWRFMEWLEERVFQDSTFPVPILNFHTANPEARRRMVMIHRSILRRKEKSK